MKSNPRNAERHEDPLERQAPLSWRAEELDRLRERVRELVAAGHPRSVASVAAFNELTARRALERAKAGVADSIESAGPPEPTAPAE